MIDKVRPSHRLWLYDHGNKNPDSCDAESFEVADFNSGSQRIPCHVFLRCLYRYLWSSKVDGFIPRPLHHLRDLGIPRDSK